MVLSTLVERGRYELELSACFLFQCRSSVVPVAFQCRSSDVPVAFAVCCLLFAICCLLFAV